MRRCAIGFGLGLCALVSGPALPVAPRGAPVAAAGDVLVVHSAGIEGLLADPRDRGLLKSLRMVGQRLLELPAELEQPGLPAPLVELVLDMLGNPFVLQVGLLDGADPGGGPPVHAQLTFLETDPQEAAAAVRGLFAVLQLAGARARAVPERPGITAIQMNGATLYHGSERPGEFVLALNRLRQGAPPRPESALPPGVQPVLALRFDGRAAQPLVEMMLAQAGPDAGALRRQLEVYNLVGPGASSFHAALGHGTDRTHGWWKYTGYAQAAQRNPMFVRDPLSRRDLAMVPADATWARVSRVRLAGLGDLMREMAATVNREAGRGGAGDPFDQIATQIGVHPQRDLLAHLGSTCGFYMSDSTGGGGLLSAVCFMEVADAAALGRSLQALERSIVDRGREHARGYVRARTQALGDLRLTTLAFPGLPVPLEPSWTVAGGFLFVGATPQAVTAAVGQTRGAPRSILDHAGFREVVGDRWQNALDVGFSDVPRLARSGYGLGALLASALSNAVRSPADPQRDAGPVLPPFAELLAGAKAAGSAYRIEGEDLVGTFQADRSVALNSCAALGMAGAGSPMATAMWAGVLFPAVARARDEAQARRAAAHVEDLAAALKAYAADNRNAMPRSMEALRPYVEAHPLRSPFGPAADGRGDYWLNTTLRRLGESRSPSRHVAVYDRAMYGPGRHVAVGFFDGHVELLERWTFEELIAEAPNAGTDFDLPGE